MSRRDVTRPARRLIHREYEIDDYGFTRRGETPRLAVILLNRNLPAVTDALCTAIEERSTGYDLFVAESGSDPELLSRHCSFHFVDNFSRERGLRIARGLNASLELIERIHPGQYNAYWFLTNDVVLTSGLDYIGRAVASFASLPRLGLIESGCDVDRSYTWSYMAAHREACATPLPSAEQYPPSVRRHGVSAIPFPIIRSLFLRRACAEELHPVLDEANWRNWGNDEDLGLRAWQAGWWVGMDPCAHIREDAFLTTRRSAETRTENVDSFRREAEAEMHRFVQAKYGMDIRSLRTEVCAAMLEHLDGLAQADLDIAHCIVAVVPTLRRLIRAREDRQHA